MQFSKNKQFIYFASIVVAFVSLVLRTLVRGDYASLVFLDTHRNLLISDFMTCIRYIVVYFVAVHFHVRHH